jgi:hypothetical protein
LALLSKYCYITAVIVTRNNKHRAHQLSPAVPTICYTDWYLQIGGAIVTVDGFGNHHVGFVNVIGQPGRRVDPVIILMNYKKKAI